MENSKIEWTNHTFNPWIGCAKVSAGCQHCYAERLMDLRWGRVQWGVEADRQRTGVGYWNEPLRWDREAAAAGTRPRVFCGSLCDVFEDRRDLDQWRTDLFALIRQTPNLDWLLLTKRPETAANWIKREPGAPLPNVWVGTSAETQEQADRRVPFLLRVPAVLRFLSLEPLIGPIDHLGECPACGQRRDLAARCFCAGKPTVSWIIVGGESGPTARPMAMLWVADLVRLCREAEVPLFFKQWGEFYEWPSAKFDPESYRVGKQRAGRSFLGRTYDAIPPSPAAAMESRE